MVEKKTPEMWTSLGRYFPGMGSRVIPVATTLREFCHHHNFYVVQGVMAALAVVGLIGGAAYKIFHYKETNYANKRFYAVIRPEDRREWYSEDYYSSPNKDMKA